MNYISISHHVSFISGLERIFGPGYEPLKWFDWEIIYPAVYISGFDKFCISCIAVIINDILLLHNYLIVN